MVEGTKPEGATARFDGYIAELREFFASRSVRFGRPEDVVAFAELVSVPGPFGEEMGSLLRSFLYYEDEQLSREDLLDIVTAAVGDSPLRADMPGLDDALRQLFRFVNNALRQRGSVIPSELQDESPVEDERSVILGSSPEEGTGHRQAPVLRPQEPAWIRAQPPEATAVSRPGPDHEGVLLRAVAMSAAEAGVAGSHLRGPSASVAPTLPSTEVPATHRKQRQVRGKSWLIPAGAFAAAAGVLLYLFWPALMHVVGTRRAPLAMQDEKKTQASPKAAAGGCVQPAAGGVSRAALEERSFVAHNLLDGGMYGAALQQLHTIAMTDPGFPGVHLDESVALLQSKQAERAREAIDVQIGISDCLARLPNEALDAYCATQFSVATMSSCRPQLAHIRQAAELQAALVHLELGHRVDADDGAAAALKQLQQDDADDPGPSKGQKVAPPRVRRN